MLSLDLVLEVLPGTVRGAARRGVAGGEVAATDPGRRRRIE
jgi:hypothetical protein